jgi:hypothetical protein
MAFRRALVPELTEPETFAVGTAGVGVVGGAAGGAASLWPQPTKPNKTTIDVETMKAEIRPFARTGFINFSGFEFFGD